MFRHIILLFFFTSLVFAQNSKQLRDSIIKYKDTDPSLAIEFGIEFNALTLNQEPNSEIQNTYALMGEILLNMGLNASALDYLKQSVKIYGAISKEERNFPNISQPPWVILNIGSIYFSNRDYDKAEEKFKEAISLFEKISDKDQKFFGINTATSNLALISQTKQDYKKAEKLFRDVYERRKEYGKAEDILYSMASIVTILVLNNDDLSAQDILDTAENFYKNEIQSGNNQPILKRNMGYMYLNMGAINQYKKQFEKAIFYLNKSEPYIEDFPFDLSAIGSRLAECYLGLNNLEKAEDIANKNLKVKNLSEQEKIYNYKVLENVYKAKGLNSKLLKIKDSLILISSGSSTSKIIKSLNNFETEVQLANSARELNESKIRYNTYLFVLIICSIILFFSLATIRVNYNYQKEKGNRLEAEKQLISSKLDQKNRELVSKSNFILQRNEYLKKIKTKLESSESTANNLQSASYELNSVINSEKSYKDFDKMFVNVFPDFYSKLNKIAELSSTDLRLASYIKMNHTNSEIAIISGVSSRTIESQRYRLSKKLNLDKDQSLNSFLMSI
jgi:tetratricopeptide (TPR) repeat protein